MEDGVNKTLICNYCNAELPLGLKFCTECGKRLELDVDFEEKDSNQETCPNCDAKITSDLRFCTECGISLEKKKTTNENINKELQKRREQYKTLNSNGDPLNTVTEFLNKAASSLEDNLNKLGESANTISKSSNNSSIMKPKKKIGNNGYLICDKCEGYYELKPDENADDFSDVCECGGKLKQHKSLPDW
jgi:predicted nucleic acid-binding Zn ribbon protein